MTQWLREIAGCNFSLRKYLWVNMSSSILGKCLGWKCATTLHSCFLSVKLLNLQTHADHLQEAVDDSSDVWTSPSSLICWCIYKVFGQKTRNSSIFLHDFWVWCCIGVINISNYGCITLRCAPARAGSPVTLLLHSCHTVNYCNYKLPRWKKRSRQFWSWNAESQILSTSNSDLKTDTNICQSAQDTLRVKCNGN